MYNVGVRIMPNYDLQQGFIDSATSQLPEYQSWVTEFPILRTQKLKQLLENYKLEASEFIDVTSIINEIPDQRVQQAAHLFDFYKTHLSIKDLSNDRQYSIPLMAVFSKSGRASSNDLAIPTSVAETYALENFFPNTTSKVIGIADISKTRLSTTMSSEQLSAVIKSYQNPNLYKHVVVHFMGLSFVNTILGLFGRLSPETKVVSSKVIVTNNMDSALTVLAETIKNLIRSSE
jgi:hypothetical protein